MPKLLFHAVKTQGRDDIAIGRAISVIGDDQDFSEHERRAFLEVHTDMTIEECQTHFGVNVPAEVKQAEEDAFDAMAEAKRTGIGFEEAKVAYEAARYKTSDYPAKKIDISDIDTSLHQAYHDTFVQMRTEAAQAAEVAVVAKFEELTGESVDTVPVLSNDVASDIMMSVTAPREMVKSDPLMTRVLDTKREILFNEGKAAQDAVYEARLADANIELPEPVVLEANALRSKIL